LSFFSRNRLNLFAFHDRDHCGGRERTLRDEIVEAARDAGVALDDARICILTMPRVLGYVFNPLSTYFCYGADGRLAAVVYEVHNTHGERHRYSFAITSPDAVHRCRKRFFVSPFLDMELDYVFNIRPPEDRVSVVIRACDDTGPVLTAAMVADRRPLTDGRLLRLFFSIPILTVKVIAGIHWEALRIWLKGVRIRSWKPATIDPRPRGERG
jgi:hypothetical protein